MNLESFLSNFRGSCQYSELRENREIPEKEDIAYEIVFDGKIYDAVYYVLRQGVNANSWKEDFYREYKAKYSKNLSELSQEEVEEVLFSLPPRISDSISGVVWFTLESSSQIVLYYDNFKNRLRGEDL